MIDLGQWWIYLLAAALVAVGLVISNWWANRGYDEYLDSLRCICGDDGCWKLNLLMDPAGCYIRCNYCAEFGVGPHPEYARGERRCTCRESEYLYTSANVCGQCGKSKDLEL